MKSYTGVFSEFYVIPDGIPGWGSYAGGIQSMWTFEGALNAAWGDFDIESFSVSSIASIAEAGGIGGLGASMYAGTYGAPYPGEGDTSESYFSWYDDGGSTLYGGGPIEPEDFTEGFTGMLHTPATVRDGVKTYQVWSMHAEGATSDSAQAYLWLGQFFPQWRATAEGNYSFPDGANFVTKMSNTGIYYQVPPINSYGFLDDTYPFALSVKNEFFKMSDTPATGSPDGRGSGGRLKSGEVGGAYHWGGKGQVINPCAECGTIGRAINEWDRMSAFYVGLQEGGVYNPYDVLTEDYYVGGTTATMWDSLTHAGLSLAVTAGTITTDEFNTLVEALELQENTYGTAAFGTFYVYEAWYGILTTYSATDSTYRDDLISLMFYHPYTGIGTVRYDYPLISWSGYPSHENGETMAMSPFSSTPYGSSYEIDTMHVDADYTVEGYLTAQQGTMSGQDRVPHLPKVWYEDSDSSEAIKETILGDSDADSDTRVINAHSKWNTDGMGDAPRKVNGDISRRFGRKLSRSDSTYWNRIGTIDFSLGFLANKAWILQNTLDIWSGAIEQQVKQQPTRNLDRDLMHPVGMLEEGEEYSTSTPTGDTSSSPGSSY